ncbi:MAG: methyltransferase [Clostridia bacterium]|nr:methyltransferase [Clostridia bacterium]
MMHQDLRKHYLGSNTVVFTDSVHRFGTDAVLLAHFASPRLRDKTLELGTGCGIISLIWCRNGKPAQIDALELQDEAVDLVRLAIEENNCNDRLKVIHGDLKQVDQYCQKGSYDLVVMNPPYKKADDGVVTPIVGLAIARHEIKCDLNDICTAAATMLNSGGRFCMCQRPARLTDVLLAMHKAGVEPKRLRFVHQKATAVPNLFLVEGKKGANTGLSIERPLVLETDEGEPTDERIAIYGEYYEQKERNQ